MTCFTVSTCHFLKALSKSPSHMFRCEFGQAVFKNNCSRKKLSDMKKKVGSRAETDI